MEKKNTVLLTVIAIATLLVAVVGATFAYFSANIDANEKKVPVTVTTEGGTDVFTSAVNGEIVLNGINNSTMTKGEAGTAASTDNDGNTVTLNLTAGQGTTECTYDIVYVPEAASTDPKRDAYTKTTGVEKEFTLSATVTGAGATEVAETQVADGAAETTLVSNGTISNKAEDKAATTQVFTFTGIFYNADAKQDAHQNKTYAGNIVLKNVVCKNGGKVVTTAE